MAKNEVPDLSGIVQIKGAARPEAIPQRAAAPSPEPDPDPEPWRPAVEPRAKALTLRLTMSQYERLRDFAHVRRLSHQDVLERALLEHMDREEKRKGVAKS